MSSSNGGNYPTLLGLNKRKIDFELLQTPKFLKKTERCLKFQEKAPNFTIKTRKCFELQEKQLENYSKFPASMHPAHFNNFRANMWRFGAGFLVKKCLHVSSLFLYMYFIIIYHIIQIFFVFSSSFFFLLFIIWIIL